MPPLYLCIQLFKWENETTLSIYRVWFCCRVPVIQNFQAISHSLGHKQTLKLTTGLAGLRMRLANTDG